MKANTTTNKIYFLFVTFISLITGSINVADTHLGIYTTTPNFAFEVNGINEQITYPLASTMILDVTQSTTIYHKRGIAITFNLPNSTNHSDKIYTLKKTRISAERI